MAKPLAVGQSPPRPDGFDKVTGRAQFIDDLAFADAWHGATVRCPHPHARIKAIDVTKALVDRDVVVITAKDLPGPNVLKLIADDWPVLASDLVSHAYEAVALVAAPTRERAYAAAAKVQVTYEVLAPVIGIDAAITQGDLLAKCNIDHGDVERALSTQGATIVEGVYETGYQEHIYIETNGMVALAPADGSVEVVGSMQCPYYVHKALAYLFHESDERVRVRQATTGGGFGGKEDYPDMIAAHAALLARRAGRPVKIIYDRHEDIVATTKRHPSRVHIKSAVMPDGTFVAHDIEVWMDGGAYVTLSPVVLSRGVLHSAGPYRCANVRVRGKVMKTNTCPNGAFRGFGAPQTELAIERHVDRIGRAVGIDPLTLRLKNAYEIGDVTATGQKLTSSVAARACLEQAILRTDFLRTWQKYERERATRKDDGKPWRGIGLSLFWHGCGFTGNGEKRIQAKASVALTRAGRVEIRTASTDIGQGTLAVFEMLVAEASGLPRERIHMPLPDTKVVPDSGPTVASRTVMVVGDVVARAARGLADKLLAFAASMDGVSAQEIAAAFRAKPDVARFDKLARAYVDKHGELVVQAQWQPLAEQQFDETTYRGMAYPAFGWGCDVVEVEVDPDTLMVRPTRVVSACDVGKVIHPVLCTGQVDGGTLQAVAWGYMEEIKMKDGRYQNDRLATYIIPTTRDVPDMESILVEDPAPAGPFGAKGVGELPMDGGAPALLAAIENASGIVATAIPATPERLLFEAKRGSVLPGASLNVVGGAA